MSAITLQSSLYSSQQCEKPSSPCSLGRVLKVLLFGIGLAVAFTHGYSSQAASPSESFLGTFHAQQIARSLGDPYPARFKVLMQENVMGEGGCSSGGGQIHMKSLMSRALYEDPAAQYTKAEAIGFLAHEVAHDTLGHSDEGHPSWQEFDKALETTTSADMATARAAGQLDNITAALYRTHQMQEREADLFTVRIPQFAKGLIHRLRRSIIGQPPEVASPSAIHPPTHERVAYLTDAVCRTTQGADLDLCTQCPLRPY